MNQLKFDVRNQIITRKDHFQVVADSKNYLYAEFTFTEEWQGENVIAIFGHNGNYFHIALKNNVCLVPWEVIKAPNFSVSLFCDNLITANIAKVGVEKSGFTDDGQVPGTPTPTIWDKYMAELDERFQKAVDEKIPVKATETQAIEGTDDFSYMSPAKTKMQINHIIAQELVNTPEIYTKETVNGLNAIIGAKHGDMCIVLNNKISQSKNLFDINETETVIANNGWIHYIVNDDKTISSVFPWNTAPVSLPCNIKSLHAGTYTISAEVYVSEEAEESASKVSIGLYPAQGDVKSSLWQLDVGIWDRISHTVTYTEETSISGITIQPYGDDTWNYDNPVGILVRNIQIEKSESMTDYEAFVPDESLGAQSIYRYYTKDINGNPLSSPQWVWLTDLSLFAPNEVLELEWRERVENEHEMTYFYEELIWDYAKGNTARVNEIWLGDYMNLYITNVKSGDFGIIDVYNDTNGYFENMISSEYSNFNSYAFPPDWDYLEPSDGQHYRYSFYYDGNKFDWSRSVRNDN